MFTAIFSYAEPFAEVSYKNTQSDTINEELRLLIASNTQQSLREIYQDEGNATLPKKAFCTEEYNTMIDMAKFLEDNFKFAGLTKEELEEKWKARVQLMDTLLHKFKNLRITSSLSEQCNFSATINKTKITAYMGNYSIVRDEYMHFGNSVPIELVIAISYKGVVDDIDEHLKKHMFSLNYLEKMLRAYYEQAPTCKQLELMQKQNKIMENDKKIKQESCFSACQNKNQIARNICLNDCKRLYK